MYWWTPGISEKRITCPTARRALKRYKHRTRRLVTERLIQELADARAELKNEISKAKRMKWKELVEVVWGSGYRIVMKKFGQKTPILSRELVKRAVETLFPKHPPVVYEDFELDNVPNFSASALEEAWKKMRTKRSPSPDGIPPEVVKIVCREEPLKVLEAMNFTLVSSIFPRRGKVARLVLLKKEGKPDNTLSSYRPVCLLDTFDKLFEHLLLRRLNEEIERTGLIINMAFGKDDQRWMR